MPLLCCFLCFISKDGSAQSTTDSVKSKPENLHVFGLTLSVKEIYLRLFSDKLVIKTDGNQKLTFGEVGVGYAYLFDDETEKRRPFFSPDLIASTASVEFGHHIVAPKLVARTTFGDIIGIKTGFAHYMQTKEHRQSTRFIFEGGLSAISFVDFFYGVSIPLGANNVPEAPRSYFITSINIPVSLIFGVGVKEKYP